MVRYQYKINTVNAMFVIYFWIRLIRKLLIYSTTGRWEEELVRNIFIEEDAQVILATPIQEYDDYYAWNLDSKSKFSIKSAYKLYVKQRDSGLHYWNFRVSQVPEKLRESHFTLGREFAECSSRLRVLGPNPAGKAGFAECRPSGTRQTLSRALRGGLGKKKALDGPNGDGGCHMAVHFAKNLDSGLGELGSPGARHVASIICRD
jgi:hypothetical protein